MMLLTLVACDPEVKETGDAGDTGTVDSDSGSDDTGDDSGDDTGETGDTDTGDTDTGETGDTGVPPFSDFEVVASTTDYTTGVLVTISADGVLTDNVAAVSSDAAVRASGSSIYVLNRSSENTVQLYADGDYAAPKLEFSTGDGSNPQDVALCGSKMFVSLYDTAYLGVYDPNTGLVTGTVDLSDYADPDGSPEAGALYAAPNGFLYVALEQLDYYTPTYESADGSGTLLKVDCSALSVVDHWDVGPNPAISPYPMRPERFLLSGGNYFNDDYSGAELDGGVWSFDTTTDTLAGPHLLEKDVGANIGGFAGMMEGAVMTTFNDGYTWSLVCLDLTDWTYTVASAGNVYVASMVGAPDGRVWVGQAPGFGYGKGTTGFVRWDPVACTAQPALTSSLGPSSIAVRSW